MSEGEEGEQQTPFDMAGLLRALSRRQREPFKAPKFDGSSDVELFIRQFTDVAEANEWSEKEATLHMRSHLEGTALGCGEGDSLEEISTALRARFGMTMEKAREAFLNLKRDAKQTLHEHGSEVSRLVRLGFPMLPADVRETMGVDGFTRSFESQAFRRFMLTVTPTTLQEAVRQAERYYAVTNKNFDRTTANTVVDQEDTEVETMVTAKANLEDQRLEKLEKAIEGQVSMMSKLLQLLTMKQQQDTQTTQQVVPPRQMPGQTTHQVVPRQTARQVVQQRTGRQVACFQCGGPHLRRQCPQIINTQSGNDMGPTMA
jgi:hypothetical protein